MMDALLIAGIPTLYVALGIALVVFLMSDYWEKMGHGYDHGMGVFVVLGWPFVMLWAIPIMIDFQLRASADKREERRRANSR